MFHTQSVEDVLLKLHTRKEGLTKEEVAARQLSYGQNTLPRVGKSATRMSLFLRPWKSPLLIILLAAGGVSGLVGEFLDMGVIVGTAVVNALIGFFQEYKASRALEALRSFIQYQAVAMRDGVREIIDAKHLVPGDIIVLQEGDQTPADGRVITSSHFSVDESPLTGESLPIVKVTHPIAKETSMADRINMVYGGTRVVEGHALFVVTSIGQETEIGRIAMMVSKTEDRTTPLQERLHELSRNIGLGVLILSIVIFGVGLATNIGSRLGFLTLFQTAVAVAVAAIPEGLTISLTVLLSVGMQMILKRNALVRRMVAAETLGAVSVICTDKTGTITVGKMTVTGITTAHHDVIHDAFPRMTSDRDMYRDALLALRIGVMCNGAAYSNGSKDGSGIHGDMVDVALVRAGERAGLVKRELDIAIPAVAEVPFSSKRKYMATLHEYDHERVIYVKGAGDVLWDAYTHYEEDGSAHPMTAAIRRDFMAREQALADDGLRVLSVAYKKQTKKDAPTLSPADVTQLTFVGFLSFSDPPRPDVKDTIALAKRAGIRIVMITGDHARTAKSIARDIGLMDDGGVVVEGKDMMSMDETALTEVVKEALVFARVNPEDKIKIVQAFHRNGHVVAMTGDGVNDAPALKGADIGIALGSGTDVAKEVADIVLLDDRLGTIVDAVEQGRAMYQNIRKVILYLLSGSLSEVCVIAGSLILGLPLALLPAQILWINLIQDSFPNIALSFDAGEKENMHEPPRKKDEPLLNRDMKILIGTMTVVSNILLVGLYVWYLHTTGDVAAARTLMFAALSIATALYIYSVRSMRRMIWQTNPLNNHYLTLTIGASLLALVLAVYWPPLQTALHTIPLSRNAWTLAAVFGIANVCIIEIVKWVLLSRTKIKAESK